MTTTQTIAEPEEITPVDILQQLLDSAEANAEITSEFMANFDFYGKSLKQHSDELQIVPPDNPKEITPDMFRELHIRLLKNIQKASHYLAMANSLNHALNAGGNQAQAVMVARIIERYRRQNAKRPAMSGIESMARSKMGDTADLKTAAKILKEFWRIRLDSLIEVRRCLEQIGISMHSEMKYLEHHE